MARSASCNNKCPQCRAGITLPQAFNMQKINEITCRLRQGVLAMDSLLHPRPSPRVVTPPRATPPVSVPPRLSPPMSASPRTTVPALAPPTTSFRATIVLPRTPIAVPVTAVPALFTTFARNPVPPEPATPGPLPATSTPDPAPRTAPLHVPAPTRAPPPIPAPPRTTLTATSRPPTMPNPQEVNDGVTSCDVSAVTGQGPHFVNDHLARPAAVTTRPGERAADAANRGTPHSPPTRMYRYAADFTEPESESESYCDEVPVLTRDQDDDLDDLPYYNRFQPTHAPGTASTTTAATAASSLAGSYGTTRCTHRTGVPPEQLYGTYVVAPRCALAGLYTPNYTRPSYNIPPPALSASAAALPCERSDGVRVLYAPAERLTTGRSLQL
jgi:hypothetical protein